MLQVNYTQQLLNCDQLGGRICSKEEIQNGAGFSTGCNVNNEYVLNVNIDVG